MLIIFTGNGKGKTTAALGQALRALGNGSKVLMVQFIKGPWESGEHKIVKKLADFSIVKKGKGFVKILGDHLPIDEHIKAAEDALEYACLCATKKRWNIIILDEIWNALSLQLLTTSAVCSAIKKISPHVDHLIMTGRDCPGDFIKMADLVTEMREVKHPFACGVKAKESVEF